MDAEINDTDVAKVAEIMSSWKNVGTLGIGAGEISDIESEYQTPQERKEAVLTRWIMMEEATYRKLYDVLIKLNQREADEKISEITGAK